MVFWKKILVATVALGTLVLSACTKGENAVSFSGGGQTLADSCVSKVESQLREAESVKFTYQSESVKDVGELTEEGFFFVYKKDLRLDGMLSITDENLRVHEKILVDGESYIKNSSGLYERIERDKLNSFPNDFESGFKGIFAFAGATDYNEIAEYIQEKATRNENTLTLKMECNSETDEAMTTVVYDLSFSPTVGLTECIVSYTELPKDEVYSGDKPHAYFMQISLIEIKTETVTEEFSFASDYPLLTDLDYTEGVHFSYEFSRQNVDLKTADWRYVIEQGTPFYQLNLVIDYEGYEYDYLMKTPAKKGKTENLEVEIVDYERKKGEEVSGREEIPDSQLDFSIKFDWKNMVADMTDLYIYEKSVIELYPILDKQFTYSFSRKSAVLKKLEWSLEENADGYFYQVEIQILFEGNEYNYVLLGQAKMGMVEKLTFTIVEYSRIDLEHGKTTGMSELNANNLQFDATFHWANGTADFTGLTIRVLWTENF